MKYSKLQCNPSVTTHIVFLPFGYLRDQEDIIFKLKKHDKYERINPRNYIHSKDTKCKQLCTHQGKIDKNSACRSQLSCWNIFSI